MNFKRRYRNFFNPNLSETDAVGNVKPNFAAYRRMIKGQRKIYWQLILMGGMLKVEVDKLDNEEFHEAYAAFQVLNKEMNKKKGGSS